jgi:hypothetical protein
VGFAIIKLVYSLGSVTDRRCFMFGELKCMVQKVKGRNYLNLEALGDQMKSLTLGSAGMLCTL